jgi:hypothetical protein
MNMKIWAPLQVAWLVLSMFSAHNSIQELNSSSTYCGGSSCQRDDDCVAPCACNPGDFTCYFVVTSRR